jgi:hypothetical protein
MALSTTSAPAVAPALPGLAADRVAALLTWAVAERGSVHLIGPQGIGKTAYVRAWCREQGLRVVERSLPVCTPRDFCVPLPVADPVSGQRHVETLLLDQLTQAHDGDRYVLLLDEFSRADRATLNTAMELLQERTLAGQPLPGLAAVVALDNPAEDGDYAGVLGLDLAQADRVVSRDVRSVAATISHDERRLFALLCYAQRLAATGRSRDAETIVEAVGCNPTASLAVQRRARRLDRELSCHYLQGWRPAAVSEGPLWEADHDAQRRVMDRLEELAAARHRTVWSAGVLAINPDRAGDVRERIVAYLDEHLAAVDADGGSVDVLADRLGVTASTRRRWHRQCEEARRPICSIGYWPDPDTVRRWESLSWEQLDLESLQAAGPRRLAVRRLRAALGRGHEAWSLAFLLLREGWELPLAEIPGVVAALRRGGSDQEDAA